MVVIRSLVLFTQPQVINRLRQVNIADGLTYRTSAVMLRNRHFDTKGLECSDTAPTTNFGAKAFAIMLISLGVL